MKIFVQNIPKQLRDSALWCCWKYIQRDGQDKPTKVPFCPMTGKAAKSNDPATFGRFEQATFALDMGDYDGIGIGIFGDICAIDIDHCISEDGVFSDMAEEIINTMNSYWEISPSGHGIRILFKAPGLQYNKELYYINNQRLGLEVYTAGFTNKYVTITGNSTGTVGINERTAQLRSVLDRFMRREVPQNRITRPVCAAPRIKLCFSDELLIKKAKQAKNGKLFERLMAGDYSDYRNTRTHEPDQSAGDIALCNLLAFWTSHDADQMDRIFRSSGLMREKWDRPTAGSTYGAITIQNAINQVTKTYSDFYQEQIERDRQPMPVKPKTGGARYGW